MSIISCLIKIKENSSGKISVISSDKEEQQENMEFPVIIKSKSIRHAFFVIKKE